MGQGILRILFVDDSPVVRKLFVQTLASDELEIHDAHDFASALKQIGQNHYAVVLTDYKMPGGSGLILIDHARRISPETVFVLVSGYFDFDLAQRAVNAHRVAFVLQKPWRAEALRHVVDDAITLYWEGVAQRAVAGQLRDSQAALNRTRERLRSVDSPRVDAAADLLLAALDLRQHENCSHCRRVESYSLLIARALGMGGDELRQISLGALLHDIGTIGISDTILGKQGPLEEAEWNAVCRHPQLGARMIASIDPLSDAHAVVLQHHERWDGGGYPLGIRETEIVPGARVVAVADALESLLSRRPYRAPVGVTDALGKLRASSGVRFDPEIVAALDWIPNDAWAAVRETFPEALPETNA